MPMGFAMSHSVSGPTPLERFAATSLDVLQRSGLRKIAYSSLMRNLGKRFLLRDEQNARARVIASGLGKGLNLLVLPETPKSYWLGTHEPDMQKLLRESIKRGMTVYDCGANIGYFSVIFARLVGPTGHVFAFEPSPDSLGCLRAAVTLNNYQHLTVIPQAVWHKREVLRFARGAHNQSLVSDHVEGVLGESAAEGNCVEISATSLDEFVYAERHPPPDFIKIDVEGSEGKAVTGALRLISEHRPTLLLEIHGAPGHEVWSLLKDLKYVSTNIATGEVPQTSDEFAIWIRQYIAVPMSA
jgi:FkbM family methyltransferase